MKRLYHHVTALLESGRLVCSACGVEVDESLLSEVPCSMPTTSVIRIGSRDYFINVWNCKAQLSYWEDNVCHPVELPEELEEDLLRAVDEQGSITTSGWYSIPDWLLTKLEPVLTGEVRDGEHG